MNQLLVLIKGLTHLILFVIYRNVSKGKILYLYKYLSTNFIKNFCIHVLTSSNKSLVK